MLIGKEEADKRLSSNSNLLNRLRSGDLKVSRRDKAMTLFGVGVQKEVSNPTFVNPFANKPQVPPATSNVNIAPPPKPQIDPNEVTTEEIDARDKLDKIQHEALNTLMSAIQETKSKIGDLGAAKAAVVAAHMGKIVDTIRNKGGNLKDKQVHLHFYTPEPRKIEEFETIDV